MGYYERAADRLTLFYELDSLKPEVWLYRGCAQLKNGNMAEAMTDLNKYLTLKPNNPDIYYAIAEGYTLSEDMDMGHVYYNKAAHCGNKKAMEIMKKYQANFVVHKKRQGIPVSFKTDKHWSVDEFNDTPTVSSCNGVVFYSSNVKLTFAILENSELLTNPKASCTMWEDELNQDGVIDIYKTSTYDWTRTVSADTWTSPAEIYDIKVLKLTPRIPNNQIMVYIWGKPEDVEAMDLYITGFLESIRIGQ
jgi:tetratricopeptide (TPR) repeat protein